MKRTGLQVIEQGNVRGQRSGRRLALWGCGAVMVAVLLSSLVTLWLIHRQPVTVSFAMKQTLDAFYLSAGKQSLSPEQSKILSDRFTNALQASLADYQTRHNVIILVSPAVVGGVKDVTREIQHDVARRMQFGGRAQSKEVDAK
ncbi:type-F conjugative transfer system protein TrbI [Serratia liquefaciens]|uniref:type-F conjugative transfer system protein TrbI n=1 Tax=Serratia liquefaciens TaxID=614 RepID=UPI00301DF76A